MTAALCSRGKLNSRLRGTVLPGLSGSRRKGFSVRLAWGPRPPELGSHSPCFGGLALGPLHCLQAETYTAPCSGWPLLSSLAMVSMELCQVSQLEGWRMGQAPVVAIGPCWPLPWPTASRPLISPLVSGPALPHGAWNPAQPLDAVLQIFQVTSPAILVLG